MSSRSHIKIGRFRPVLPASAKRINQLPKDAEPEKKQLIEIQVDTGSWAAQVAGGTPIGDKLGFNSEAFVNKFFKSLRKIGLDFLEQSDLARRTIRRHEDHTVRNAISFAAGIGLGIGVGILLAPASGEKTRSSIAEKVLDVGDRVRDRFSPEVKKPATGTEGK